MASSETHTSTLRHRSTLLFTRTGRASPLVVAGIFILLFVRGLIYAAEVLVPVVIALFLSLALRPAIRFLEEKHIPRRLGAALILLLLIGGIGLASLPLIDPAQEWISNAPQRIGRIEKKVHDLLSPVDQVRQVADEIGKIGSSPKDGRREVTVTDQSLTQQILAGTRLFLSEAIAVVILLYFLLAYGDDVVKGISRRLVSKGTGKLFLRIVEDIEMRIPRYLFTVTLINACVGLVIGFATFFVGLPNPILWGVLAGFLNYIPYIGPLIGQVIIGMVALLTFDTFGQALIAPLFYLGFTFVEGNFITPMILGNQFTINPLMIILSMTFWGWVWGIVGLFVAVPLLMLFVIIQDHILLAAPSNGTS